MLIRSIHSILQVGNADSHIVKYAEEKLAGNWYRAEAWYAAGVLEGLSWLEGQSSSTHFEQEDSNAGKRSRI